MKYDQSIPRANVSETEGAFDELETGEGMMSKPRGEFGGEGSARGVDF